VAAIRKVKTGLTPIDVQLTSKASKALSTAAVDLSRRYERETKKGAVDVPLPHLLTL